MKCNLCGKELDTFDLEQDITVIKWVGYGSEHDGDHIELRICNNCLDELIRIAEISPVTEGA